MNDKGPDLNWLSKNLLEKKKKKLVSKEIKRKIMHRIVNVIARF